MKIDSILSGISAAVAYGKRLNRKKLEVYRKAKRSFFLAISRLLLRNRHGFTLPSLDKTKSVAFVMIGCGIGDAIVTSGVIALLRGKGIKVTIIGEQRLEAIYDELIPVDHYISERQLLLRFWVKYDALISFFSGNHRNVLACIRLKPRVGCLAGFDSPYPDLFDINFQSSGTEHVSLRCERVLAGVFPFISFPRYQYQVFISDSSRRAAEIFLGRECGDGGRGIIVINQCASDAMRSLSDGCIQRLVGELSKQDSYELVLMNVVHPDLFSGAPHVHVSDLRLFSEAMALISMACLVITTDTSFVHACNALNKSSICIYNNRGTHGFVNNLVWAPNYEGALQVFSTDNIGTDAGDDLRLLDYSVLHEALVAKGILQ